MASNTSPSLLGLASDITKNATTLTDYLSQAGHPQPSFEPGAGYVRFPPDAGGDVLAARAQLIHAARQLQFLALGPTESLQWYALAGTLDTATLRWLYHFKVPEAVPADQEGITFVDLARKLGISQRTLTRILRHAMTNNVFREFKPGMVAHTSLSLQLADPDNPIRGVVGHQTETVFPAVARMVEAHDKWGTEGMSATHAPFHDAFGTDLRALDWVARDPVRSARFTESMKGGSRSGPFNAVHTVNAFDWKGLGEATVVDVGGSAGHISKAIAETAPGLRFVVQDQPSMVSKGKAELEIQFQDRIMFQEHDFFQENPESAPDVFFLRQIFHDWPDADARRILGSLVPKMAPGRTKLLINEAVMPEPGSTHPSQEKYIRNLDMIMLSMFNGLERTREDWEELIRGADPSLLIVSVEKPIGGALSMIQIVRV